MFASNASNMERRGYPRFCHQDVEYSFAHWILHADRHDSTLCRWCNLNIHIVAYAVSIFIEHLLNEWYIQNAGSNTTIFMQSFINVNQAKDLLRQSQDFLSCQDIESMDNCHDVAKKSLQELIGKYFPNLQNLVTDIRLSYDAYMYIPLLKYNDTFNMLSKLYMEGVIHGGNTYRSQCFLLASWHMNGLVAVNPGYVWTMWGEGLFNDLIVWISTSNEEIWEKKITAESISKKK